MAEARARDHADGAESGATATWREAFRVEIYGLVILAFAVLLLLSLASFSKDDLASPMLGRREAVSNLAGPVGARVANLFLGLLGLSAFLVDLILFWLGARVILGREVRPSKRVTLGVVGVLVAGMMTAHFTGGTSRPFGHDAGGLLGAVFGEVLRAFFSSAGAYIVTGTLGAVSLSAVFRKAFVRYVLRALILGVGAGLVAIGAACKGALLAMWRRLRVLTERGRSGLRERRARSVNAVAASASSLSSVSSVSQISGTSEVPRADIPLPSSSLGITGSGRRPAQMDIPAVTRRTRGALDAALQDAAKHEQPQQGKAEPASREAGEARAPRETIPNLEGRAQTRADRAVAAKVVDVRPLGTLRGSESPVTAQKSLQRQQEPAPVTPVDGRPVEAAPKPPDGAPMGEIVEPASLASLANEAPQNGPRIIETEAMRRPQNPMLQAEQGPLPMQDASHFELPPLNLLRYEPPPSMARADHVLRENATILEQKLRDFGIDGSVMDIRPGPVVTTYEFKPAAGIKISRIVSLSDDLTMALASMRVRIVAPIPGKAVVGIEVPNRTRQTVFLSEILSDEGFRKSTSKLTIALGKDIEGKPTSADLARMPHLLVAGATGTGKSVGINAFITSILYKATPKDVRFIFVDPKILELSVYEGIPHLMLPVVSDPKKAAIALKWACGEMERRYHLLSRFGVRNLAGFNALVTRLRDGASADGQEALLRDPTVPEFELAPGEEIPDTLPALVVVVDEFADLMMCAPKDVEQSIARLAQKARAAGIHIILATQRPSTDVITGLIKANFPTRVSFQVASKIDSKVVLDMSGAESLLGMGDMLYVPPGTSRLLRVHGAFVSDEEVKNIVAHWKTQGTAHYDMDILKDEESEAQEMADEPADDLYDQAVQIVAESRQASVSYVQRRLSIGYQRAARIIERMEREGVISRAAGANRPREVLVDPS